MRCKQCLSCRINKQSALALRCLLEQRTTLHAEFWTLTYADAPEKGDYSDFSAFLKRLRQQNVRQGNPLKISFLGCGEYGSKTGRFHFHGLIFNSVPTQKAWLPRLWPHGFVYIGTVTPKSIRYTARYTLKFHAKGREAVANWSKRPPLGANGMQELATYMKNNGYKLTTAPSVLKIEGSTYALDQTMKEVFVDAFSRPGEPGSLSVGPGAAKAHLDYLTNMKFGDPVALQRKSQEERNRFYETARFTNETL